MKTNIMQNESKSIRETLLSSNQSLEQKEISSEERKDALIKQQLILLERASKEIQYLNKQNHLLNSKQDVFDKMYRLMTMNDRNNHSCVSNKPEDIEWEISKHIDYVKSQNQSINQ